MLLDTSVDPPGKFHKGKFNKMRFIGALQLILLQWRDMEKRENSVKPIIHNWEGWKFDWFHSTLCYWTVENGLYWSEIEVNKGR